MVHQAGLCEKNGLDGRDRPGKQIIDIATAKVLQNKGPDISLGSLKQTPQNRSAEKKIHHYRKRGGGGNKGLVKSHNKREMIGQ